MRAGGILLPVSALPSKYGIGGFSDEAYQFVDFLKEAGQTFWQVLPLGPTGFGDSPYQAFSTFAGNPYYISLEQLQKENLLTEEECREADCGEQADSVDYGKLYRTRFAVLRKAWIRFCSPEGNTADQEAFRIFREENRDWLEDYCLFRVLKDRFGGKSWTEWPDDLKNREPGAVREAAEKERGEEGFYAFLEYEFLKQWKELKAYANRQGIRIIGDIPIYVAMDSSDAWAAPELFQFDRDRVPLAVAGVPPDVFSADGQLWGNPLYDWEYHKKTGYSWWVKRMTHCRELYDMIRIDHFRGFEAYYSVPYGEKTARNGKWVKGPGMDLFRVLKKAVGQAGVIAEDLGVITDGVKELIRETGYPGMKVLQFAFGSGPDNSFLPWKYPANCVVYTGTHDNDTTVGWYRSANAGEKRFFRQYVGRQRMTDKEACREMVRLALASPADLAVIPMQDWLELGNSARINLPATVGTNWKWRMLPGQAGSELKAEILEMTQVYGRAGSSEAGQSTEKNQK